MKYIQLTRGRSAIVDDDIYEKVSLFKWHITGVPTRYYAVRQYKTDEGKMGKIWLHREIAQAVGGIVTFKNSNTLDCRRSNLIKTSRQESGRFRKGYGKSKYLGVSINTLKTKYLTKNGVAKEYINSAYVAKISYKGKHINLGRFEIEEMAAKAYDQAVLKFFGKSHNLNFPDE